ncbi:hypothetical protein JMJ35_007565 [Cladonia borealis]|uniref:MJ1316 RNA cyclic group end recognition domain-containing protein n=1 Tax=Cladonia borealis TaxID=184061 RepID=A0AA39QYI7_9LECA|nr:hypothetical protein JMJ35_007565 [Cladonia borealis]
MAPNRTPLEEVDSENSLAEMTLPSHNKAAEDMIPLQTRQSENAANDDIEASSSDSCPSPKPTVSRSSARRALKVAQQSRDQNSKPLLRPAKDIISRIRHDPALEESDFVVGYHDRHAPEVMEMDVSSWKGGGDFTDEEWIPQHRILYFRRKGDEPGRRIWDREKRLDILFGSGIVDGLDEQNELEESKRGNDSEPSEEVGKSS